jgi:hypothetical protein
MNYRKKIMRTGVSIVTRLRATQFAVRIPGEEEGFSLLQNVHACSGAHSASYSVVQRLFPGGRATGVWS